VPSFPRDKGATWRTLGTLCRELDWSRQRLLYELQNGLRHRIVTPGAVPPGYVIDWHDRFRAQRTLNIEASEVKILVLGRWLTVGIEVLPPTADASPAPEPSPPPPSAPQTPPPPKTVSNEDLRACVLAIKDERPDAPLGRDELWREVEKRLGQWVARDRVWAARKKFAPHWVSQRGRRRKPAQ
jgi:hypothetical protein